VSRAEDRQRAEALLPAVSRETWSRLDGLVELLDRWNAKTNLVAPREMDSVWTRHVADSLQLLDHVPAGAKTIVDLGSGGGFPGLVLAAALAGRPGARVHLVESVQRKAAFLREAVRRLGLPAQVHALRIEDLDPAALGKVDVVTARALAPLPQLLELARKLLETGAIGLFPKGKDVNRELTVARESWSIGATKLPSVTDGGGTILKVEQLDRRAPAGSIRVP
jgi:16S rRNA (guanine527-N7)-methyltransferase